MGMGVKAKGSIVNKLFIENKIEKNLFAFNLSTIDYKNVP